MTAGIEVPFVDCPPGLFRHAGKLCFKSDYSSKPGQQDAYCVDSGEYFWGGTDGDLIARRALLVTPLATFWDGDLREAAARLCDAVANQPVEAPESGAWERAERATGKRLAAAIGGESALREAAQAVIDRMFSTYKARNGREVGIEGDDGEKCWIVHSDDIKNLRAALASPAAPECRVGDVASEVIELACRDIARTQTDFLGRMAEALCTYEGIFDEHPNGYLPDHAKEEAEDQISTLAGLALAQLAMLRSPSDPAVLLAARPLSGEVK